MSYYALHFPSPFKRNGCVPLALAAVAMLTKDEMLVMANIASQTPRPITGEEQAYPLLFKHGSNRAYAYRMADVEAWARIASEVGTYRVTVGADVIAASTAPDISTGREVRYPTAAAFARQHPKGRYFLLVMGGRHAIASIGGKLKGTNISARARVVRAYPMTLEDK